MFPFEGVKNATNLQDLWEDEDLRILVYVLSSTIVMILLIWCTMCLVSILVGLLFFSRKSKSKNNGAKKSLLNLESKNSRNSQNVKGDTGSKAESETSKEKDSP